MQRVDLRQERETEGELPWSRLHTPEWTQQHRAQPWPDCHRAAADHNNRVLLESTPLQGLTGICLLWVSLTLS